ncbi:MAG: beta-lactamase family protein [Hyphomicrobiales bacterium]|nr:beta-lactamase family protein [Hyphomicrobiales bacterium]
MSALVLLANCSAAKAADWPFKETIQPLKIRATPKPGSDLPIKYDCGGRSPCGLSDFMKNTDACALYVISAGKPVLHRDSLSSDRCKKRVSKERYRVASVTKSVVSLLFGRVFTDSNYGTPIDVEKTTAASALSNANINYPNKKVSVGDLLRMSSAMKWSEKRGDEIIRIEEKPNGCKEKDGQICTLRTAVTLHLKKAKFKRGSPPFNYSGFDTVLLGMLVENRLASVSGLSRPTLDQGLEFFFWKKLNMRKNADWKADYERHPAAYCCLSMSAGDLAELGNWVLQKYRAGADPMSKWVRNSIAKNRISTRKCSYRGMKQHYHYGYQWWVLSGDKNGFTGIGKGGQYLHLFPDQNVVVVQLSADDSVSKSDECESMLVHRLIADMVAN